MKIDAHQHYWITARTDYGFLTPESGVIYGDYLPRHLRPHLEKHHIEKTVIVQAVPTVAETEFMLGIAAAEDTVAGVVGWLDLTADDFEEVWTIFRKNPKFVGIRPMIQDLSSEWIAQEKVVHHLQLLADEQFAVDLQANPRHLPFIIQVLEKVPHLHSVVDHLAKPPILEEELEPWASEMKQIASYPNTMCKLSGMVYGKSDKEWSKESIHPFAQVVIEAFGKKRVMFGSDWPVCLLSASYDQVVELLEYCLDDTWTEEERADLYGGNAIRFYRLPL